jgi:hypothetical protein
VASRFLEKFVCPCASSSLGGWVGCAGSKDVVAVVGYGTLAVSTNCQFQKKIFDEIPKIWRATKR